MAHQRTQLLLALILLSPVTALLSFAESITSPNSSTFATSSATTLSYTSTTMRTYFASTSGTTEVEGPLNFPSRVIGFMAPEGKCGQFSLPVTVTSNSTLNVDMSSNNPANFYLLPTDEPQASPNSCSIIGDAIVTAINFTQFTLHWTPQHDGTFYFIFTGPTAVIMLADHGSVKPVLQNGPITFAASTATSVEVYSETSTTEYTATATAPPLYLQETARYATQIGIIIVLIVIGGLFCVCGTRLRSRRPVAGRVKCLEPTGRSDMSYLSEHDRTSPSTRGS